MTCAIAEDCEIWASGLAYPGEEPVGFGNVGIEIFISFKVIGWGGYRVG